MDRSLDDLRVEAGAPVIVNVYRLARISQMLRSAEFGDALPRLTAAYDVVAEFARGYVFGVVASTDSDAVLAFRGSDENREWMAAMAYGQTAGPVGRVHAGIAEALEGAHTPMMAALYDAGALEKRLWITGHSLGGGLATLAALRLDHEGFAPQFMATFGAPPVLDRVAAAALPGPFYRVVNSEDMVPEISWPTLFDSYTHAGELMRLLPSGAIAEARHSAWLATRLDRAAGIGAPLPRSGSVHDHFMVGYVEKLERLARADLDAHDEG